MPQVKKGDTVKVHYKGTFNDGSVFDTSKGMDPLQFTVGSSEVIHGFEAAVIGMQVNETKRIQLQPEEAYGKYRKELALKIDRSSIPDDMELELGADLEIGQEDGSVIEVTVIDISDKVITVDANHPLAGQVLNFEIELIEILK